MPVKSISAGSAVGAHPPVLTATKGFRLRGGPAALLAGFLRVWRAIVVKPLDRWLDLIGVELSISEERGPFAALRASVDLRAAQIRAQALRVATVDAASGCLDCGVIQAPPRNHRCVHCGSQSLFDAGKVMRKEAGRIGRGAPLVFAAGRKRRRK